MKETALNQLRSKLKAGRVYRRAELAAWSSNVDRHLKALVNEGVLTKLQNGLYYRPKQSSFGAVPPVDEELLKTFLETDEFLAYSPNTFNSLGLGTTQLYHLAIVLNPKRHGILKVGDRYFHFVRKRFIPKQLTKEVLLVELLNNLKRMAEERDRVLETVNRKIAEYDNATLQTAARRYGTYSTQKFLNQRMTGY